MSKENMDNFLPDELDKDKLIELLSNKQSFRVVGIDSTRKTVKQIEAVIEKLNMTSRVYTENRSALMGAGWIPNPLVGFTLATSLVTTAGITVHNLLTFNPDYEIRKNYIKSTITVVYKK